jgi:hypothetical protein
MPGFRVHVLEKYHMKSRLQLRLYLGHIVMDSLIPLLTKNIDYRILVVAEHRTVHGISV